MPVHSVVGILNACMYNTQYIHCYEAEYVHIYVHMYICTTFMQGSLMPLGAVRAWCQNEMECQFVLHALDEGLCGQKVMQR